MPKYKNSISSKLPKIKESIFTTMSALANKHDAINLSQGFPDFKIDSALISYVEKYMKQGFNQYAPMAGLLRLREKISEKLYNSYNISYNPESEITITAGATQAIFTCISAFVKEEEEVIIFTPAYDCYQAAIELVGGRPVFIQMKAPDYKINWEEVKKLISQRTKMIIINTPHNPTGKVLNNSDLETLQKIVADSDIIILSDEVYEHIIFDDINHESICKYKNLADRSMAVFSFGKTFHITGWKLGYCIGPENLMNEFRKVHQFNVFSCNHPVQHAIADYLSNSENYLNIKTLYKDKRDLFLDSISSSNFKEISCQGTYFQLLDYSNITDENDIDFSKRLVLDFGLASIPVSVFYNSPLDEKVLRFCFAKKDETIYKACEILNKL